MKLATEANLQFPLLLWADERLMDGMHRVAKAHVEQRATISASRFIVTPRPDHVDVNLSDLSYGD
jgi:hypothetical protein